MLTIIFSSVLKLQTPVTSMPPPLSVGGDGQLWSGGGGYRWPDRQTGNQPREEGGLLWFEVGNKNKSALKDLWSFWLALKLNKVWKVNYVENKME